MNTEILKARLRGTLITALEPRHGAEADALIWNGRKPARHARLIVRAACAEDVAEAVRFAAEHGLTVSPRGGGHQFTGISAKADMVIDLGALDALKLDVERRMARVEPAVTNARLAAALERHGLGFPLGHCGSVPMSGYLLGGGVGWNSAEWGFACFSVAEVELVLADGSITRASAEQNPDIYWAVRGGGPEFFGVVTAYHLKLQEAAKATSTTIRVYPGAMVAEVSAWAEAVMATAPACVEFTTKVAPGPNGPVLAAMATVFAKTEGEAREIHTALGRGAPEALQVIGPMPTPIPALYEAADPSMPKGKRFAVDTVWSDGGYVDILAPIVESMAQVPSETSMALVVLRPNAVATPATAAFSCHGRVFGALYAIWDDAADDAANIAWLRAAIDDVAPVGAGAYVGEADLERPDRALPVLSAESRTRLAALSMVHDPNGLFLRRRALQAHAAE